REPPRAVIRIRKRNPKIGCDAGDHCSGVVEIDVAPTRVRDGHEPGPTSVIRQLGCVSVPINDRQEIAARIAEGSLITALECDRPVRTGWIENCVCYPIRRRDQWPR